MGGWVGGGRFSSERLAACGRALQAGDSSQGGSVWPGWVGGSHRIHPTSTTPPNPYTHAPPPPQQRLPAARPVGRWAARATAPWAGRSRAPAAGRPAACAAACRALCAPRPARQCVCVTGGMGWGGFRRTVRGTVRDMHRLPASCLVGGWVGGWSEESGVGSRVEWSEECIMGAGLAACTTPPPPTTTPHPHHTSTPARPPPSAHLEAAHKRGLHFLRDGGGDGAQRLPARAQHVGVVLGQQRDQGLQQWGSRA